jgi:hypothetical protein
MKITLMERTLPQLLILMSFKLNSCQEDTAKSTSVSSTLWHYVSGECVNVIFSRPIAVICCQTTPAVGLNNT